MAKQAYHHHHNQNHAWANQKASGGVQNQRASSEHSESESTQLLTGARPMIQNPDNKKLLTSLGSFTPSSTIIPEG
jgi:hypothetical protein